MNQTTQANPTLITAPILLSDAGSLVMLAPDYAIEIDLPSEGKGIPDHLVIIAGEDARSPRAAFKHPNLAAKANTVHHFRAYWPDGRKKWYCKPGVNFYFVVPRNVVTLLPEKGHSYIKAEINGVKLVFNVSGGSSKYGWSDWLLTTTDTSCNHKRASLKKLAEVAIPYKLAVEPLKEEEQRHFDRLMAEASVPAKVIEAFKAGEKPMITLVDGCSFSSKQNTAPLEDITYVRMAKWHTASEQEKAGNPNVTKCGKFEDTAKIKSLLCMDDGRRMRVKPSYVDWLKTGKQFESNVPVFATCEKTVVENVTNE